MINVLQLIVSMPLFNINFPLNAVLFNNLIVDISNFNIIPISAIEAKIFHFSQIEAEPPFEQLDIF